MIEIFSIHKVSTKGVISYKVGEEDIFQILDNGDSYTVCGFRLLYGQITLKKNVAFSSREEACRAGVIKLRRELSNLREKEAKLLGLVEALSQE